MPPKTRETRQRVPAYSKRSDILSLNELVRVIQDRSSQISSGASPTVNLPSVENATGFSQDFWKTAVAELISGKIPMNIIRTDERGNEYTVNPNHMYFAHLRHALFDMYNVTQPKV